ncbi:DUF3995 domain-containing protein [Salinicoccus carnicancri]|uniref:DUF3995 domain-containing protein n=1 Tax=Salinicoccus carnicancri TaxID=558170 RepID=UPI0002F16623|nr:DUF3995 domain-containing protein [Salinicoccus carnicancri]
MNTKKVSCTVFLIAGTLHSIATFYWSFGGEIGLLTVGQWTLGMKERYGYTVLAGLFVLGLFKLAAAWMPFILYNNDNKLLEIISYVGGGILVIHGGVNTVAGWLKILGVLPRQYALSEIGQAFIWDPLFLLWGAGLIVFLVNRE